jgi:uncharacterized membrane protein YfcA
MAGLAGLGLVAGVVGGMFGIGGGLIIVPALTLIFGFELKHAIGTSLMAQLLPVGLLGVIVYHRQGNLDVPAGLSIACGLFLGALLGAQLTGLIHPEPMKRLYGGFLLLVGAYFLFFPSPPVRRVKPVTAAAQAAPALGAAGAQGAS